MAKRLYRLATKLASVIPAWLFRVQTKCIVCLPRSRWSDVSDQHTRIGGKDDEAELERLWPPDVVSSRFERGSMVVVYEEDRRIVGGMWFDRVAPRYEKWLQIHIPHHVRWVNDVVVDPEFRGRGIAGRLGSLGRAKLPPDIEAVAAVITGLNDASRRSAEKSGYSSTCVFYVRIAGVTAARLPWGWRVGLWRERKPLHLNLGDLVG